MQRIDNYWITFLLGIFWLLITPSWQIPKSLCFMNRKFLNSKINIWWYSWEWRLIKHHILFTLVNFIDCQILNLCTCIFLCFIPIDFIIIICNIFITHIRKKNYSYCTSFRVHIFCLTNTCISLLVDWYLLHSKLIILKNGTFIYVIILLPVWVTVFRSNCKNWKCLPLAGDTDWLIDWF